MGRQGECSSAAGLAFRSGKIEDTDTRAALDSSLTGRDRVATLAAAMTLIG